MTAVPLHQPERLDPNQNHGDMVHQHGPSDQSHPTYQIKDSILKSATTCKTHATRTCKQGLVCQNNIHTHTPVHETIYILHNYLIWIKI